MYNKNEFLNYILRFYFFCHKIIQQNASIKIEKYIYQNIKILYKNKNPRISKFYGTKCPDAEDVGVK